MYFTPFNRLSLETYPELDAQRRRQRERAARLRREQERSYVVVSLLWARLMLQSRS